MLRFLSALIVIFLVQKETEAFSFGSCVEPPIIKDFDVSKYLGVWYENERSNVFFEKGLKCVFATYSAINNTAISVENRGFNPKKNEQRNASGVAVQPNAQEPNKLLVTFKNSFINRAGSYNVWMTDYQSYSVVYSCTQVIPYVFKIEMIWILSRDTALAAETVTNIKNTLTSSEISVSSFEKTDQNDCKYSS